MYEPIIPAQPEINEHGVAQHPEYGDVYHSLSGARGQAEYVFLSGNHLPKRWQNQEQFTICETGFGLGNNFLTAWYHWRQDPLRSHYLHYVSFEGHPLTQKDLAHQLLRGDPQLQPLAKQLIAAWPSLLPGVHRLEFEHGQVTLTLFFGHIKRTSIQCDVQADAFFLDGFSPRLNPAMWTPALFSQLVRMAAPGATLATWCTASAVRRELQNAGFVLAKKPGYAFKREMLTGKLRSHLGKSNAIKHKITNVAIIGSGITGSAIAYALAKRGIHSHVFDPVLKQGLKGAHLGHKAAAMMPLVARQDPPRARLSRLGIALAAMRWAPFLDEAWYQSPTFALACDNEQETALNQTVQQLSFDTSWLQWLNSEAIKHHLGYQPPYGGLFFPKAYVVRPEQLLVKLLSHELITPMPSFVLGLQQNTKGWVVETPSEKHEFQAVILANAANSVGLLEKVLAPEHYPRLSQAGVVQGQVGCYSLLTSAWPKSKALCAAGYILSDKEKYLVLGSSYDRSGKKNNWSAQTQQEIEKALKPFIGPYLPTKESMGGWVGKRMAMSDHRPVIDQAHDHGGGLWVATAMGSNGFSWASVAAEQIGALLAQEPRVLSLDLQRSVALR